MDIFGPAVTNRNPQFAELLNRITSMTPEERAAYEQTLMAQSGRLAGQNRPDTVQPYRVIPGLDNMREMHQTLTFDSHKEDVQQLLDFLRTIQGPNTQAQPPINF